MSCQLHPTVPQSTTLPPTTTEKPTTTELPTTRGLPTTTRAPTTTVKPTTTGLPTTTELPITTESPTTMEVPTTTKSPTTTELAPSTTAIPPTTTEKTAHPACLPGTRYNAVLVDENKVTYFFTGEQFWTVNSALEKSEPKNIRDFWREVDTPVDAAYRNKRGHIVFFKGPR